MLPQYIARARAQQSSRYLQIKDALATKLDDGILCAWQTRLAFKKEREAFTLLPQGCRA